MKDRRSRDRKSRERRSSDLIKERLEKSVSIPRKGKVLISYFCQYKIDLIRVLYIETVILNHLNVYNYSNIQWFYRKY